MKRGKGKEVHQVGGRKEMQPDKVLPNECPVEWMGLRGMEGIWLLRGGKGKPRI